MKRRYISIPGDLAEQAWKSYSYYGIDIVTGTDSRGNSVELEVSYHSEENEGIVAYRVSRHGEDVKVNPLSCFSTRTMYGCRLSRQDKQKLLALFQKIDKAKLPHEPRRGPHNTLIVTEAA